MDQQSRLSNFIAPDITKGFILRVIALIVFSLLFFSYVAIPIKIQGYSMEPLYHDKGFNFIWTPSYWFSEPKRGDVVAVRFAGTKVLLLKRIVAFEGQWVEFIDGKLFIDFVELEESYINFLYDWELEPRLVKPGNVYVIGDNRNVRIESHVFGQTSIDRIVGTPLW